MNIIAPEDYFRLNAVLVATTEALIPHLETKGDQNTLKKLPGKEEQLMEACLKVFKGVTAQELIDCAAVASCFHDEILSAYPDEAQAIVATYQPVAVGDKERIPIHALVQARFEQMGAEFRATACANANGQAISQAITAWDKIVQGTPWDPRKNAQPVPVAAAAVRPSDAKNVLS